MIEKIMKAVKSRNKKRGRNITIGAVVGMLLSCTVAMGTDVSGLEITKEGGTIIFKDKDGTKFKPGTENDPYHENTWNEVTKTYTNNTTLSGTSNDSSNGCGIILNGNLGEFKFINNALITGTATKGYGIGIYNQRGKPSLSDDPFSIQEEIWKHYYLCYRTTRSVNDSRWGLHFTSL